jgi:predicted TIM-barrel fold metal-dependent hydrolase
MHVGGTVKGVGLPKNEIPNLLKESNVKWAGGVGPYSPEVQDSLGHYYIPAFGHNEFFAVLNDKGQSGLLDPSNFTAMFSEAEELFKSGKIKGFGEIHTQNVLSSDDPRKKRNIRAQSPVVEKMYEMSNRYDGFVAIHSEYSKELISDVLNLSVKYPRTTTILDHCIFFASTDDIRSIFSKTSNVVCEISANGSVQSGNKAAGMTRIHGGFGGGLKDNWKELIQEYPDRFMLGSDPCCGIGTRYKEIISKLRSEVLANLPTDVLEKVAYKNAVRIFHLEE